MAREVIIPISAETQKKHLKSMLLIRRFEEKTGQMYGLQKIGGFCHLYIGQEAVAVGTIGALDLQRDYVATAYRDHGHALACGMEPQVIMAELFGKADGCSKGKGGSMHLFDANKHFLGGNGIVGSQIPIATGVAFAIAYKKEPGVVLCFFGDGAIHQGVFHESLNMAKIWKLPIVYICENNQYGMGTDFRRVSAVEDFSSMGTSYGIEGEQVDGMNVDTVYYAAKHAITRAQQGIPGFLEIRTYRYKGHSMSDPATYRTKDELDAYKKQDPVLLAKTRMISQGIFTEDEYKKLDEEIQRTCMHSVEFAEQSSAPSAKELFTEVYA